MKTYFVAISLLILVSHAFARIGETEQQIEARYGKSIRTLESGNQPLTKAYRSSDLSIAVTYIDGVSQSEMFCKQDGSELSSNEIAVLLEANVAGSKWIEDPTIPVVLGKQWKLESGGRTAAFSRGQNGSGLLISTDLADRVLRERKAEAEKEKLKGFWPSRTRKAFKPCKRTGTVRKRRLVRKSHARAWDHGITAFESRRRTEWRTQRFPLNRKSELRLSGSRRGPFA
jgi:hypothetical protein